MDAFWLSLVVIFVAELGDKSQLMALTFATRHKALPVLVAITVATAIVHAFSVLAGGLLGSAFPSDVVSVAAGLAFFGFAYWTWRGDELDEGDENRSRRWHRSPIVAVGVAFFLAELGDKTMLATVTLATREGWLGTWIGSTVGMVAADALAILVGRELGTRVSERTIRIGAALGFVVFGIWLVVDGLVG